MQSTFSEQVRLLVRVLRMVAKERCFALKGGTAINLFYRDMPRDRHRIEKIRFSSIC